MSEEMIYDQKSLEQDIEANCGRPYQQCELSLMDTIADPDITFDENGICNYYHEYLEAEKKYVVRGNDGVELLSKKMNGIKDQGKYKKYDCILGLSGGVDSTYLCLLAKEYGLNPLIVHFDNGWNSELAVKNIENVVNILGFDLYTYVVDWNEFRELQLSYLKASVVDVEVLTDHAFMAVLYEQARKWRIRYVLAGMNVVTEQVLPPSWIFNKTDDVNIKTIQKKFGTLGLSSIRTFPFMNNETRWYCRNILKMQTVTPLNFLDYKYEEVKKRIIRELSWQDYGGKHYESIWTRFYQGYILPKKFNIDKRKAHLSNLIFSGQISKEQAINKIQEPALRKQVLNQDKAYCLKKIGVSPESFNKLLAKPRREHSEYNTQRPLSEKYPILKGVKYLLSNKD